MKLKLLSFHIHIQAVIGIQSAEKKKYQDTTQKFIAYWNGKGVENKGENIRNLTNNEER